MNLYHILSLFLKYLPRGEEEAICNYLTFGNCNYKDGLLINKYENIPDVTFCQTICQNYDDCYFFNFLNGTCNVYHGFAHSQCEIVAGSPNEDLEQCFHVHDNSCATFVEENCSYNGTDTGFSAPPGQMSTPEECEAHCKLFQTIGGCNYWVFDRIDFSCTLLDSAERYCSGISGPKFPAFGECFDKGCDTLICDENAKLVNSTQFPCGQCVCNPGWAGPGTHCGPDNDNDGWSDEPLDCQKTLCAQDNCVGIPNSGQEDADGDGEGDVCDKDADNDGVDNVFDNCPNVANPSQADTDGDTVGDECDNCVDISNSSQEDTDRDGQGDACEDDVDNDGIENTLDNCMYDSNSDQMDVDGDGIGDVCDNCKKDSNPGQEDSNHNNIGDACEGETDTDNDGIPDDNDNCPNVPNSDQLDSDDDDIGDACDDDSDNDGIVDGEDNCPIVSNPDQEDSDKDGVGDACSDDCDGDSIVDSLDACPCNGDITVTDFRGIQNITLQPAGGPPPIWQFRNDGKEIFQEVNSAAGIAIGDAKLSAVEFEGTMYVGPGDDDWIGAIFSFQDSSNFYLIMGAQKDRTAEAGGPVPWQLKRVKSSTGPINDDMANAMGKPTSVPGQTEILWISPHSNGGWKHGISFRFKVTHKPLKDLINLQIYEGATLLEDSGDIYDYSDDSLKGGRLGVFCMSQADITWSALTYRCVPED